MSLAGGLLAAVLAVATVSTVPAVTWPPLAVSPATFAKTRTYTVRPDQAPTLSPGQRFIVLPEFAQPFELHDASGVVLPIRSVAVRVLTLLDVTTDRGTSVLTFSVEGSQMRATLRSNASAQKLPGLKALVEDPTLRRLQAVYEGKQLWVGGLAPYCVPTNPYWSVGLALDAHSVRISGILRTAEQMEMGIGTAMYSGGGRESAYEAVNPLIVIYDLPAHAKITGTSFGMQQPPGEPEPTPIVSPPRPPYVPIPTLDLSEKVRANPGSICVGYFERFADAWDFERSFMPASPLALHPEWSAATRAAIASGDLKKGMTREMVAAVMGYPSIYGTAADMLKLNTWRYDDTPPFNYWVHFKNGKVVDFGADGHLP